MLPDIVADDLARYESRVAGELCATALGTP
jgi:hypothetical protein